MKCPKCSAEEGFVEIEFHGIKAKACACGAIMIMEITDEYDRYFEEEQAQKKEQENDTVEESPACYFCLG